MAELEIKFNERQIARIIRRVKKELEHRWIPVTERLPKNQEFVLISFKEPVVPNVGFYDVDGKWTDGTNGSYDNFEVAAWMPLPEPYTGGME